MIRDSELVLTLRRTARVFPSFLFLAFAGCLIAYFILQVPLDRLATVVSVPLVLIFFITRIVLLRISSEQAEPELPVKTKPGLMIAAAVVVGLSFVVGLALFLSAGIYYAMNLGLHLVQGTLVLATACLGVTITTTLVVVASLFGEDLRSVLKRAESVLRRGMWNLLYSPSKLADKLFATHLRNTEHWS